MSKLADSITINPCPDCQDNEVKLELFSVKGEHAVYNGECECGREWALVMPSDLEAYDASDD